MTALVTRPREDSEGVARELAARGVDVVIEPLLDIVPVAAHVDIDGVQGILATSANGVRALARVLADRTMPVWAVGDASARVARELGYTTVESAGGDVDTLAALVMDRCKPEAGAFLHAAGTVTAGDLAGRLEAAGFTVRRVVLYEARTATVLSASLTDALSRQGVQVALFFSPRTAATFATLVRAAGLTHATGRIIALALSPAVAAALAALPWADIRVAAAPTQTALLALLDHSRMTMTESDQPKSDAPEVPVEVPAEAPAEVQADSGPAEDKSTPWGAIVAALGVVALVAGGLATWPEWKYLVSESHPVAMPMQAQAPDELEVLRTDLAATREQLRRVEERLAQPASGPVLTPLENRLTQNEAAIRALQAQPQVPARLVDEVDALGKQVAELKKTSADAAAVLRLADRVEKVEAGFRDMQARRSSASAMMLAVGQLREALSKAMPYDAELRAVRALGGQDADVTPALDVLKPRAISGIPTAPVLSVRFAALAPAIVRATVLPAEQSWWRQTMDRFASLVVVRREDGNAAGTQPAAIVARAEAALNQGDLGGAVGEVETLTGGPADQAANWLADAKARLAADKAVSELTAHVVASIGAGQ
ncbi:MAG: uroporphyrinogen-III synthase [Rhodospirillaceae bacterium]|nr:uroporphyrinogen-III synthase [Rhodospirillales bacterium]